MDEFWRSSMGISSMLVDEVIYMDQVIELFRQCDRSDSRTEWTLGGSYSLFAGRDATRALAKMELTQSCFSDEYDELTDLTNNERSTVRNWHEDFRGISF